MSYRQKPGHCAHEIPLGYCLYCTQAAPDPVKIHLPDAVRVSLVTVSMAGITMDDMKQVARYFNPQEAYYLVSREVADRIMERIERRSYEARYPTQIMGRWVPPEPERPKPPRMLTPSAGRKVLQ